MTTLAQETSKLTDRYQTTVPSGVRKQLKLGKGDRIRYRMDAGGRVYIEADRDDADDPALGAFLDLIAADIKTDPARLQAFDGDLHDRLKTLIGDVVDDLDLDAPLSPEDE
ncbi:type II toxin-antitoxin system PrlF family antitoxin [uncultured Thiohalocapsa sp.]|uniref:type II toxin-antitoxin system PrlF family antitoxin n=1 Tax=uncultured Thiohalocapsa sp. TaxID=768990 RepID=UPI0025ED076F|nr:type II toxin-antitoxin system PrlF family antitoxin [uncultured Thiohalocapsa sp.]